VAAHDAEFHRWTTGDYPRKRQTSTAAPAEPGELPWGIDVETTELPPIPVVLLARLAIDSGWQGRGLGRALFRDRAQRVLHAAGSIGIRGIVVHAISEQEKAFHLALGFEVSPLDPMTLMVTLHDVQAAFQVQ
jgi:predicted N-acetyltransferase YhbS